jgi:hypothetical protein
MTSHRRIRRATVAILALAAGCSVAAPALAAPANDDFANAASLGTVLSIGTSADLTGASSEVFEQHVAGGTYTTVWFAWTAPADGRVQVTACTPDGTVYDHVGVYTGSTIATLLEVPSAGYPLCGAGRAFQAKAQTKYWIQIDGNVSAPHLGALPVNVIEHTSATTTIGFPAAVTSAADGSGYIKPTGLVFYGFDWGQISPAKGYCEIDSDTTTHVRFCYSGELAYQGLAPGTHSVKFAAMDPWGFWSNWATSTITVPAPVVPPPAPPLTTPATTTGTPAPAPAGTIDPVVPCAARPTVRSAARLSLRTLRGRGARVTLASRAGCPLTVTLSVLGRRGALLTRTGAVAALTLKPSRTALRRMHVRPGTRLRITVAATTTARMSITVRVTA